MARLTLVMGAPGAGKSTWAHRQRDAQVVTNDRAARQAPGSILGETYREVDRLLAAGQDVVCDATGANRAFRRGLAGIARRHGAQAVAAVVDTPLEECLRAQRGRERPVPASAVREIHGQVLRAIPHLKAEGFEEVRVIRR